MEVATTLLDEVAQRAGIPRKAAYTLADVARVANCSLTTVCADVREGRLVAHAPAGRQRGKVVLPRDFEAWFR